MSEELKECLRCNKETKTMLDGFHYCTNCIKVLTKEEEVIQKAREWLTPLSFRSTIQMAFKEGIGVGKKEARREALKKLEDKWGIGEKDVVEELFYKSEWDKFWKELKT